jgi:hypothetical protein
MPSPRIDPHTEALRLVAEQLPVEHHADLVDDPRTTMEALFPTLTVSSRPPSTAGDGCGVDGTYNPGPPPRIVVAEDVVPARRRFTLLHELGHHLIENDGPLNELDVAGSERRDEAICNEVAASILIPAELADQYIPAKFVAQDVARLHANVEASRSACCVAAVRRLHVPGCVILGTTEGVAVFTAHHLATEWRIARGTAQGEDSILVKAGRSAARTARETTSARFASGLTSGPLHGDAYVDDDGFVFAVLVQDTVSPWARGLAFNTVDTGPEYEKIDCERCGEVTAWKTCRTCGEKICPDCDQCWNCRPKSTGDKKCAGYCQLVKPRNQFRGDSDICVDCE